MDFSNINFLAVLVATIASFAFGALWYSPVLFGKIWQKELGYTDEYLKTHNMVKIYGTTFVLTLIMAIGVAVLLNSGVGGEMSLVSGLKVGLFAGLVFVGTSTGIHYMYQSKPLKLWAIDSFYQIFFLGIMGAILGAWR